MAKVAVVTGANKNIGYFIAQKLCQSMPQGGVVYVCARSPELGAAAVERILSVSPPAQPRAFQLEITDPAHVRALRDHLQREHGGVDVLVNNAGFAFKGAAPEPRAVQARETLRVNYDGTALVLRELFPLLRPGARVVNVGSMAGGLGSWSAELREELLSPALTLAQLDGLRDRYFADCDAGRNGGWPGTTYGVSKALVHGLTRVYARDAAAVAPGATGVAVNAVCPGWCKSDMAGWDRPTKSSEEGADTPTWAALLPPGAPTGRFFTERRERDW